VTTDACDRGSRENQEPGQLICGDCATSGLSQWPG
jgi:hypothetical protein